MSTATMNPYEGMFLISQSVAVDLQGVADEIADMISRHGGELIAMTKWDERRLAYEIDKQKRGVYILTFFSAPGDTITELERDVNLSERFMRLMVTKADHLTMEQMQAADGREALATEAKLRAERAQEEEQRGSGTVTLGAPPKPEPRAEEAQPESEAPAEAPSDAPAEQAPAGDDEPQS
ncbi:MAG: 30S ribosomal protein S6 [Planctomycetota bacterium]